jgi:polysaccharide export outer membrane protein
MLLRCQGQGTARYELPVATGRLGAAILLVLTIAGCAQQRPAMMFTSNANEPYSLNSGDKLRVLVFGQDNLSNIYTVDGSGKISMPLIGTVRAAGVSTAQLERDIGTRLREGFIREPHVSVEVEQYRPFFVLGEVTQSGQFPYVSGMTAQTAVAIAGGFSPRAERDRVEITRQVDGRLVTGSAPVTYPLRPGDTVLIKERWF